MKSTSIYGFLIAILVEFLDRRILRSYSLLIIPENLQFRVYFGKCEFSPVSVSSDYGSLSCMSEIVSLNEVCFFVVNIRREIYCFNWC